MRELKFRAWDKENEEYMNGYDVLLKYDGSVISRYALAVFDTDMPVNVIIEQYTGLKDKNGKEIYEGDIVEYTTCYYGNEKRHRKVVEWEEWDSDDFGEPHNLGYFDLSEGMEIIGNIHENPELLEDEE